MSNSKYCPLCGAHEFEWYEGEASDELILQEQEQIEELYRKLLLLKEKGGERV